MRTAQLGGVVDTAACGETWNQSPTEKFSRTASPVCGKTKPSCSETGTGLDTSRESRGPAEAPLLQCHSDHSPQLHGPSHYDKPPGSLGTHHLHNNSASSPCRRGSTINIHQGLKTTIKTTTTAEACWPLSYTDIYKLHKMPHALAASRTRIGLTKPRRLLTFRSDRSGSTGGTYAPEQLKLNQVLPNIFLPVE